MGDTHPPKFTPLAPRTLPAPTAAQVQGGPPLSKVKVLRVMESEEWEEFTAEWLSSREIPRGEYVELRRYGGSGDLGLDVVALTTDKDFDDPWDSFQCKCYDHSLQPNEIYLELAKIIYHSFKRTPPFNKAHRVPRQHTFVAPYGVGTSLSHLLDNPDLLREQLRSNWADKCQHAIGKDIDAELGGDLLSYFDQFDCSIFSAVFPATLIKEHATTPFHVARFGGGLPPRPEPATPPAQPTAAESRYIRQMLDAYGEHLGIVVATPTDLAATDAPLGHHFERQRELFYCAESLHSYSRDTLPKDTFQSLQDEVHDGVFEVCQSTHDSGYARMTATVQTAGTLPVAGNALVTVAKTRDKQGICHQLANVDRLTWVQSGE